MSADAAIGILGGGLTGLTLAGHLREDCEVVEGEAECGGLCRSHRMGPYIYDQGGHILFSRDENLLGEIVSWLGPDVRKHRRDNRIFFKGRFVKYPFENDLAGLPPLDNFECLYGYLFNDTPKPTNFREWIYATFGRGIAEKYMIPYNEKIWNTPPEEMSLRWVADRIPKPPPEDVIKSALGIRTEGYTHQLDFYYPASGGIQTLIRALEKGTPRVLTGFRVNSVRREGGEWRVSDGRRARSYRSLVSTLPVQTLLASLEGVPPDVGDAAGRLRFNSLRLVALGLNRPAVPRHFALYFPDPERLYHRVCFYEFFGTGNVPEGQGLAVAEFTFNPRDAIDRMTDTEIVEHVTGGLARDGLIDPNTVTVTDVRRAPYAYVIYTHDHEACMERIRSYAEKVGIELCGRFSEFEYLNMDACIRRARALAERLNERA